jgi:hypothetical protein
MERVTGANIAAASLSSRENIRLLEDEGEGADLAVNENNYYFSVSTYSMWERRCGDPTGFAFLPGLAP